MVQDQQEGIGKGLRSLGVVHCILLTRVWLYAELVRKKGYARSGEGG